MLIRLSLKDAKRLEAFQKKGKHLNHSAAISALLSALDKTKPKERITKSDNRIPGLFD